VVSFLKNLIIGDKGESARQFDRADLQQRVRIATCAIMLEIAGSDDEFTEDERSGILQTLSDEFQLSTGEGKELIEIAQDRLKDSIDIWGFTNTINKALSEEEKIRILEAIWRIIYSDGRLSRHEDSLVHKLSFMLGLRHKQLIEAKLKARKRNG
jgi:uncharacterized tellurite resistance protein B-like protein